MKDILAGIGLAATIGLIVLAFMIIKDCVKELIENLKLKYKQKHRFDKPPTAKCYCVDCSYHDNKTGRCYRFDKQHTADNWFCWDAEPRKRS